ncbi:hypothetical protein Bca4012_034931 [Brassica carinata]
MNPYSIKIKTLAAAMRCVTTANFKTIKMKKRNHCHHLSTHKQPKIKRESEIFISRNIIFPQFLTLLSSSPPWNFLLLHKVSEKP